MPRNKKPKAPKWTLPGEHTDRARGIFLALRDRPWDQKRALAYLFAKAYGAQHE